jgi:Transcriptional regulator, AbiEi antitoxin
MWWLLPQPRSAYRASMSHPRGWLGDMTASANPNQTLDERIAALAATQHLCFSRDQALRLGAPPATIDRRVVTGRWQRPHPGVYALATSPDRWLQRLWAARLAVGDPCVASHATAAALHRIPGFGRPHRLEFIAPHGTHHRVAGALVHQIDDVQPHHVVADLVRCTGLPITTPTRTLIDLAVVASEVRLRHVITQQVAANRLRLDALSVTLAEIARPGKPGVKRLARVIDALTGLPVPASVAEAAFFGLLRTYGLPMPERQVALPGRGAVPGIVDGLYRAERVIIEIDSRTWHGRFRDLSRDRIRDAEAARAGYLTLRIMYEHIQYDASWVAETVRDVLLDRTKLVGLGLAPAS